MLTLGTASPHRTLSHAVTENESKPSGQLEWRIWEQSYGNAVYPMLPQVWLWGCDPIHLWYEPNGLGVPRHCLQVPEAWGGAAAAGCRRCKVVPGLHSVRDFLPHSSVMQLPSATIQSQVRTLGFDISYYTCFSLYKHAHWHYVLDHNYAVEANLCNVHQILHSVQMGCFFCTLIFLLRFFSIIILIDSVSFN